jgi:hypothetical protein
MMYPVPGRLAENQFNQLQPHFAMSHMASRHTVIKALFLNRLARAPKAIRAKPEETLTGHGY